MEMRVPATQHDGFREEGSCRPRLVEPDPEWNTGGTLDDGLVSRPSALATLDMRLAIALERESRKHGQHKNVPFWVKLDTKMRS